MIKLNKLALIFAVSALGIIISIPLYVNYEHQQAVKHGIELESLAKTNKFTLPASECTADYLSVTSHGGAFQTSIPVWVDGEIVKCSKGVFSLKGKVLTAFEVHNFINETLLAESEIAKERNGKNFASAPTLDVAFIVQTINEALSLESITEEQRMEFEKMKSTFLN
jgi:hypothetical protein